MSKGGMGLQLLHNADPRVRLKGVFKGLLVVRGTGHRIVMSAREGWVADEVTAAKCSEGPLLPTS